MALKPCPVCKHMVAKDAMRCPSCGGNTLSGAAKAGIMGLALFIALPVLIVIVGVGAVCIAVAAG